jgi:hypothetical protein
MANKTYYSESAGLNVPVGKLRRIMQDGQATLIEPQRIQFARIGADKFGSFTTDDPEIIAALDERAERVGDIFGPEEYQKRIVPAEMRAERLAEENQRLVEERNRLLAMLKQQQAKTTQPAGGK